LAKFVALSLDVAFRVKGRGGITNSVIVAKYLLGFTNVCCCYTMRLGKRFARRMKCVTISDVSELLKWMTPDMISFGGGIPDPTTFPDEEDFSEILIFLKSVKNKAFQYGKTEGLDELRVSLSRFSQKRGIVADPENIIVTTGSQQVLDLTAKIFINQNDFVGVELPTYMVALQVFNMFKPRYIGIPLDFEGMRTDILEERLRELYSNGRSLKLLYTMPTSQNPAGISMSIERRKHLLELASKYDFIILEDDPYGYITFEGDEPIRLKSMDKEGRVIYTSTFSKILGPGLRIGWIIAEEDIIKEYVRVKQITDICTSPLTQYIAHYALENGVVERKIPIIKRLYREKRDAMLNALERYMPSGITWSRPIGGLFIFVWLNNNINTRAILPDVIKKYKVAYLPGDSFYVIDVKNTMRLNFSYPSINQIEEGIKRLSMAIMNYGVQGASYNLAY